MAQSPAAESEASVNASILIGDPTGRPLTGAELEEETEEVASGIRCPVCQGLSVAASPTKMAKDMKLEVRDLLAAGYEREQVFLYFEKSYGEFIRLAPKAEGLNLVVWIAPIGALLLGAFLVFWRIRSGAAGAGIPEGETADPAAVDPELTDYLEQVRREVSS